MCTYMRVCIMFRLVQVHTFIYVRYIYINYVDVTHMDLVFDKAGFFPVTALEYVSNRSNQVLLAGKVFGI